MNPMTSFNICTQFPEHSTHQTDYKQGNVNFFVIFEKMSSEFELEISEKYEFWVETFCSSGSKIFSMGPMTSFNVCKRCS